MKKTTIFSLCIIMIMFIPLQLSSHAADCVTGDIDNWLDTNVLPKKNQVIQMINAQTAQQIPCAVEGDDWGFSIGPHMANSMCLNLIAGRYKKTNERIPVVDLGCGLGRLSALMVLAGGKVSAVEKELDAAKEANRYIFTNTKNFLRYNKEAAKDYYTVYRENILNNKGKWIQTPHQVALCDNVLHFFTPDQCDLFATRLYDNMLQGGVAFISADSPYYDNTWLTFYEDNKATGSSYPGYGVYSKKRSNNITTTPKILGVPAKVGTELRSGKLYPGHYLQNETVINKQTAYHTVKNLFKAEDLGNVFLTAGFTVEKTFYLDGSGYIVEDISSITIGDCYRSYVIIAK